MPADPSPTPNAAQIEYWNGPTGRKWAELQARLDRAFAPLTRALIEQAAPRPGERALDIGCGAGDLALALARAVGPDGRVTALDISQPMLAQARARQAVETGPRAPIDWVEADAATAALGTADLAASRFGTMFFEDPPAAFANIRRGLRPGGRLVMLCWRGLAENEWALVPRTAILPLVSAEPSSALDAPGPFAFADPDRVAAILEKAGFEAVSATPAEAAMPVGVAEPGVSPIENAVDYAMQIGPGAALLRGADRVVRDRARSALASALAPYVEDEAVRVGGACWIYEARKRV